MTAFADIVEAESSDASGVFDAILKAADRVELDDEALQSKLVMVSMDGATVNQGSRSGVGRRFKDHLDRDDIMIGWCVNHRFELGILDTIKHKMGENDNMIALVEEVVDFVFRFYYGSPRRRRIVKHISQLLDEDPAYFSGFSGTRWLASRLRAYKALWKNLPAVIMHFEEATNGRGEEANKCKGYLRKLKSARTIQALYFLIDMLEVLEPVSVAFQKEDLFVSEIQRKLSTALVEFEALKHESGAKYSQFKDNFTDGVLMCGKLLQHSVELVGGNVLATEQNLHALATAMMDALNQRFAFLNETPYREFSMLDHQMMPPLHAPAQLALYGNQEMRCLLGFFERFFDADEQGAMMRQWPKLKVAVANQKSLSPVQVYGNLLAAQPTDLDKILRIVSLALTLSPSTAGVERGFSAMNNIKTTTRHGLSNKVLSNLMRINSSKTEVADFDPCPAISHWLASAKRPRKIVKVPKGPTHHGRRRGAADVQEEDTHHDAEDPLLPLPPPDSDSEAGSDNEYMA